MKINALVTFRIFPMDAKNIVLILISIFKIYIGNELNDGLKFHNEYRETHNSPKMKLDSEMSKEAEEYAKHIAKKGKLIHSITTQGENLAMGCQEENQEMSYQDAVKLWYSEVCNPGYDFDTAKFSTKTGHFTQVVWKKSISLGIGKHSVVNNDTTCTYVVGRYKPAGNVQGEFKENVEKGLFFKNICDILETSPTAVANQNEEVIQEDVNKYSNGNITINNDNYNTVNNVEDQEGITKKEKLNQTKSFKRQKKTEDKLTFRIFNGSNHLEDYANQEMANILDMENKSIKREVTSVLSKMTKATNLEAKLGAFAGANAGIKAGKQAVEDFYRSKHHKKRKAGDTEVVKRRKIATGVSIIEDTISNSTKNSETIYTNVPSLFRRYNTSNGLSFYIKLKKDIPIVRTQNNFIGDSNNFDIPKINQSLDQNDNQQLKREESSGSFEENGLKAHNKFRKIHGSPPMEIDEELNKAAEEYAKELLKLGKLEHSKERDNAGENLAFGCSSENKEMTAEEATKNWYKEVCDPGYDFDKGGFSSETGHFSQVVWKGSSKLGIGKAAGKSEGMYCTYIVGRYKEAGNFQGKYDDNVKKGDFDKEKICKNLDNIIDKLEDDDSSSNGKDENKSQGEEDKKENDDNGSKSQGNENQKGNDTNDDKGNENQNGGGNPNEGNIEAKNDGDNNISNSDSDNKDKSDENQQDEKKVKEIIAREAALKAAIANGQKIGIEIGEKYKASQKDEILPSAKQAVDMTMTAFKKRKMDKSTAKFLEEIRRQVRQKRFQIKRFNSSTQPKKINLLKKHNLHMKENKSTRQDDLLTDLLNSDILESYNLTQSKENEKDTNITTVMKKTNRMLPYSRIYFKGRQSLKGTAKKSSMLMLGKLSEKISEILSSSNGVKKSDMQDIVKLGAKIGAIEGAKAGAIAGAKAAAEALRGSSYNNSCCCGFPPEAAKGALQALNECIKTTCDCSKVTTSTGDGNKPIEAKDDSCCLTNADLTGDCAPPSEAKDDECCLNYQGNGGGGSNDQNGKGPLEAKDDKCAKNAPDVGQQVEHKEDQAPEDVTPPQAPQKPSHDGEAPLPINSQPPGDTAKDKAPSEAKEDNVPYKGKDDKAPSEAKEDNAPTDQNAGNGGQAPEDQKKPDSGEAPSEAKDDNAPSEAKDDQAPSEAKDDQGATAAAEEYAKNKPEDEKDKAGEKNPGQGTGGDSEPGPGEGKKVSPDDAIDIDKSQKDKPKTNPDDIPTEKPDDMQATAPAAQNAMKNDTNASEDECSKCPGLSDDYLGSGDKFKCLLPAIDEAAEKGGRDSAKIASLAGVKSLDDTNGQAGCAKTREAIASNESMANSTRSQIDNAPFLNLNTNCNLVNATARLINTSIISSFHNPENSSSQSNEDSILENFHKQYTDGEESKDDVKSPSFVRKIARDGAVIGAVEGAVSAATTAVETAGGSDIDKQKAGIRAKKAGQKIAEDKKFIDQIVDEVAGPIPKPSNGSTDTGKNSTAADNGNEATPPTMEQSFGDIQSSKDFAEMGLKAHNMFRKIHSSPELKLNDELSKNAEEYAKIIAKLGRLEHASTEARSGCGENLAFACTTASLEMKAQQAVHNWYGEVCQPGYTFGAENPPSGTGHFTQVIWKDTEELGMGKATSDKNDMFCTYVVARYKRMGNVAGQYAANAPQGEFTQDLCAKLQDMTDSLSNEDPSSRNFVNRTYLSAINATSNPSYSRSNVTIVNNSSMYSNSTIDDDTLPNTQTTLSKPKLIRMVDVPINNAAPTETTQNKTMDSNIDNFADQALDAHNHYRYIHQSPPLISSKELSSQAQNFANVLAKRGLLEHDKNITDGENLAMKCLGPQETEPSGAFFTTLWYQEVCSPGFDFNLNKFNTSTGHFTQLIWDSTKQLGIGRAFKTEDGIKCEYVVARYRPAGNFLGEFNKNVHQGRYNNDNICDTITGSKKYFTARYTKRKHHQKSQVAVL